MKSVGAVTAAMLAVIGVAVGVMAAVWNPPLGPFAKDILAAASAVMRSARSVTVDLTDTRDHVHYHFVLFSNGDADATFMLPSYTADVVQIGHELYVKADARLYVAHGVPVPLARSLAARWVTDPPIGSPLHLAPPATLAGQLLPKEGTLNPLVSNGTVDGHEAVRLQDTGGSTLWVALSGTRYPLEETVTLIPGDVATTTYSDWNEGTLPSVPAGAERYSAFVGSSG